MADLYLLDTSVLSQAAPDRPPLPVTARARLADPATAFISAITVTEIQQGVENLRRRPEDMARADAFERWLGEIIEQFGERVLAFDTNCAREAGRISGAAFAHGKHPGFADVAIAATAHTHGLTVLTRNLKHFVPLGVPCLDPFGAT